MSLFTEAFRNSLQSALEQHFEHVEKYCLPALVVGLVNCSESDRGTCDFAAFGTAQWQQGSAVPANEDTIFSIASCSKAFNAVTIGLAADRSAETPRPFTWDTPVRDAIPEFNLMDKSAEDNLKLRDLCCHRTGLPPHLFALGALDTPEEVMKRMALIKPTASIRERAQYENSGIITSALALSRLTGTSLPQLAKKHIFNPLGMASTTYFPSDVDDNRETSKSSRLSHAFDLMEEPSGRQKLRRVPFWLDRQLKPGRWQESCLEAQFAPGGVCTTASDLLKWIACFVRGGKDEDGRQVLTKSAYEETTKCHQITGRMSAEDERKMHTHLSYGLGWMTETRHNAEFCSHSGGQRGVRTLMGFAPHRKFGFVIMTNATWACINGLVDALTDHLIVTRGSEPFILPDCRPADDKIKAESDSGQERSADTTGTSRECAGLYISDSCGSLLLESADNPGEAIADFECMGEGFVRPDSLYAKGDRCISVWWSHLIMTPNASGKCDTSISLEYKMRYVDYFPNGYADDPTPALGGPFQQQPTVRFHTGVDGKIVGFGITDIFAPGHLYDGKTDMDKAEVVYKRVA